MTLKYHISPTNLAENMLVKIYEAQSPLAVVYEETLVAPHSSPRTITVNGLDKVVHIVRLYAAVSNTLLHEYNVEPTLEATVFDPIQFKIGDGGTETPAANTDTYTNSVLQGLADNEYLIHRNNQGFLIPGVHYNNNPGPGGFVLAAPDLFNDKEEFTIQRQQQVVNSVVNDSVVGKWHGGFVDISANTNYSSTHLRKLLRFAGTCTYTFEALSAVPIGYAFVFTHFGADGTGTVQFLNGPLLWGATTKTSVDIPHYHQAAFEWDGANWNVVWFSKDAEETVAPSEPPAGTIMGSSQVIVGDITAGDPVITVTHNLNITGDYIVFLSVKASGTGANDHIVNNGVSLAWKHHATDKANKFYITPQEIWSEVQNCVICYLIIKQ